MATLSIPINPAQEKFIESLVKSGKVANKAHAVRRALDIMAEAEVIEQVLKSEQEMREGKVLRGDLRELAKRF